MSPVKIAEIISKIIGPFLWMPILLILLIFKTGLSLDQIKILLPLLIFLLVVIPFTYLFIALRLDWVSKWDLPKKEERRPILILLFVCAVTALLFIKNFGNGLILDLYILLMIIGFITSLVTFFWKISIHMVLDTTGVLLINFLFGWVFWPLFLLIPVVAWARLKLKRHTPAQLLAGTFLAGATFFAGLKYFNL